MLNENFIIQKSIPLLSELRKAKLNLQGFKLIEVYLSKIDSHKQNERAVTLTIEELQAIFGKKLNVAELRDTLNAVFDLEVNDISTDTIITERKIKLFELSHLEYNEEGIQKIILKCSESAMQYIFNIEELRYLRYKLRNIAQLSRKYSYHLFMYLLQNKFKKTWNVSISELAEILNTPYSDYYNLNKYVLKPCMQEINEKTSLNFSYANIRRGADRATKELVFIVDSWAELEKAMQEQPQEQAQQLVFYDTKQNDDTDFFAGACDDEFTASQIQSFMAIINTMTLPPHPEGIAFARYHYLLEVYTRFKAIAESEPISNRYSYLYKMIHTDRDKQRGESQ